jgi:hypothetical protein
MPLSLISFVVVVARIMNRPDMPRVEPSSEAPGHLRVSVGFFPSQPEFSVSDNDIKNPSAEATALSGKFYFEIWLKGGREISDEAIRKNEESHTALEEARKAELAAERERLICILVVI